MVLPFVYVIPISLCFSLLRFGFHLILKEGFFPLCIVNAVTYMVPMNTMVYMMSNCMCILVFSGNPDMFTVNMYNGDKFSDNFYV